MDILIIEDNDDDYEATLRALNLNSDSDSDSDSDSEIVVSRFNNAADAWDVLLAQASDVGIAAEQRHQFVILDLNMPGLDGRGLLARMKSHDRIKSIPVAILSTSDDLNDIDMCYNNGANAFIRKPVNWDEFVDKMGSLKAFWFRHAELPALGS